MSARKCVMVVFVSIFLAGSLSCIEEFGGTNRASAASPVTTSAPALYTGLKKRIAVSKFEFGASRKWSDNIYEFGSGMADMLTTELYKTGRFIVVERKELGAALDEQDLAASGRISKATAAKTGELLGAEYLVVGVITEFEEKSSKTGGGLGGQLGNVGVLLGGGKTSAHIGIDIRLIDATTGAIVQAQNAEGRATGSAISGGLSYKGFGGKLGHQKQTAMGKAVRQVMNQLVAFVVNNMEHVPWKAKIAAVRGDDIFINAGQNMNVGAGATFEVVGEPIIDPDTGAAIAYGETVATIQVQKVLPKAAVCKLTSGTSPEKGSVVEAAATYVPPATAEAPSSAPTSVTNSSNNSPEAAKFCPNCGAKLEPETKFCPKCGTKIQ